MYLYLVQHAEALSKEADPSRSLSEKGMEDIKKVAAFVKVFNIEVHHIFHSGKMRALQTAQMLADNITSDMGVLEAEGLAPMDDPAIWFKRIAEIKEDAMLVGHLPHLGKLAMQLLCGKKEGEIINFEMGSIVCLKRTDVGIDANRDGNWAVDWIIKPRMIE